MKGSNFSAYVSQKNWKDSDKQVECTVECDIDKQRYFKIIAATDPMDAIQFAQKNFGYLKWELKK